MGRLGPKLKIIINLMCQPHLPIKAGQLYLICKHVEKRKKFFFYLFHWCRLMWRLFLLLPLFNLLVLKREGQMSKDFFTLIAMKIKLWIVGSWHHPKSATFLIFAFGGSGIQASILNSEKHNNRLVVPEIDFCATCFQSLHVPKLGMGLS